MSKIDTLFELNRVTFSYKSDGKKILDNISLKIKKGEFVFILGKNGSGKSTLLKHLNALVLPTLGEVYIDGLSTTNEQHKNYFRKKIGMILQNPESQIVNSIVEEDVAFGLENIGTEPGIMHNKVKTSLELLHMHKYKKSMVNELSGGQKQKIAIAGVLAMKPDCILLDEPTSMLDAKSKSEILNLIDKLNKTNGTTIVWVTHNPEEIQNGNRVLLLLDGKLALDIKPSELFYDDTTLQKFNLEKPKIAKFVCELKNNGLKIGNKITKTSVLETLITLLKKMNNYTSFTQYLSTDQVSDQKQQNRTQTP